MTDTGEKHWFSDYKQYWGGFLLLVIAQAGLTTLQAPWSPITTFIIFLGTYLLLNPFVSVVILLLTWPVRRNFDFSRFIKILIAFSAVNFISQLIAFLVPYFQE